jgi:DNA-binding response OmpR family regulator
MTVPGDPGAPCAVLLDDNLLFTANLEAGLRRLGYQPTTLPPLPGSVLLAVAAAPALILVNLGGAPSRRLELLRQLRAQPELAGVRILGYTGHTDTATLHAGREAGADQVVANSAVLGHLERVLGGERAERDG